MGDLTINTSDSEMQRLTKISRMTMWAWKKDSAFVAWLRGAMQSKHDLDFELAMARHLRLAIQGSVRSLSEPQLSRQRKALSFARIGVKGISFRLRGGSMRSSTACSTLAS